MLLLSAPVAVVKAQCEFVRLVTPSSHLPTLLSIQLVERFYDPLSGTIYMDDQPISELNIQEYRKQLALVSQEPVITHHRRFFVGSLSLMSVRLSTQAPFALTSSSERRNLLKR
jgi:ABC-type cobalamin/Fe3+-siderophores transport system ATPase subunit